MDAPQFNDHDLLIRIDTKLEVMAQQMEQQSRSNAQQFAELWKVKAASKDVDDVKQVLERFDSRLRWVERVCYIGIGMGLIIEVAVKVIK